ncbi:MAG: acyloxyacyl hydrolase [Cellvibrio sp.]
MGIGYNFGKTEISLNFFHFSNAGLNRPNPGADMLLLRTSFKL